LSYSTILTMNKLIRLFYDLSVYKEIVADKRRNSLGRFSLAYLIISVAIGFWLNQKYMPGIIAAIENGSKDVLAAIPASASATIQNGILTTSNLPEPFTLTVAGAQVLSINTEADLTSLASSSAFVAMGKTHMRSMTGTDGTYDTVSYEQEKASDMTLTGNDVHTVANGTVSFIHRYRSVFPLFLAIPTFFFLWFERLFQTIVYAFILKLFGSIFNRTYQFNNYWNLTMHSIIVAEVINTIVLVSYQQSYSLIFSVAFIGTTILAYLHLPAYPKTETT